MSHEEEFEYDSEEEEARQHEDFGPSKEQIIFLIDGHEKMFEVRRGRCRLRPGRPSAPSPPRVPTI
jgi:hypothetical protein